MAKKPIPYRNGKITKLLISLRAQVRDLYLITSSIEAELDF